MMKTVFLILAVICFVLAAFSVTPISAVATLPLGLAFFAAAFLPIKE